MKTFPRLNNEFYFYLENRIRGDRKTGTKQEIIRVLPNTGSIVLQMDRNKTFGFPSPSIHACVQNLCVLHHRWSLALRSFLHCSKVAGCLFRVKRQSQNVPQNKKIFTCSINRQDVVCVFPAFFIISD